MSTVTLAGWVVEKSDGEGGWTTLPCEFRVFSPRLNDEDSLEFALPNTAANLAWVDTEPVLQIKLGGSVKWTGKLLDYDASDDEIVCTCYDAVYDALDVAEPVTGKYEAPTAANTILAAILTDTGISLGDCPTTEITIRYEKASPFNLVKYIARQVLGVDYYSSSGTTINLGTRGSTQTFSGVGAIFSPRAKSKKQKRTKIYVRGADENGVRLYGSAGAGNRVGVYNDRRATDQTTLDSIAANKLAELNTDDLATTFTVTIDKAKDLMPGDTIPITDAQRGLDGDYRITAIDFTEAEATISIIVYKKDTAERLNELEQAAEDIGIYPIVNEQLDNPSGAPAAITDLAAVEEFSGVRLDWTSNTENDLAGYIVYRDTTPTATTEYMRVNSNQVLDKNITYGVTYYYRVKPFDRAGNLGAFSNEDSVAPKKLETIDVTDGAILAAKLAKGIQAFSSNIVFSPYTGAEDSKVSWAAGTIVFADGTTQDIDAGATNVLTAGTEYYVYFVVGEAALSVTSTYSDALGDTKGLLALIGCSGTAGQQVFIQPFAGKGLNLNADVLAARCVKTANLDAGAVTADKVTLNGITETGDLDLAEIGNGDLDDITDGTLFKKVAAAALNESGLILLAEAIDSASARLTSDLEKAAWDAKPEDMDEIGEGTNYKRTAAAALDANGLVLLSKVSGDLDDVADGTSFKKVAAASLTAEGLVLLSAVSGTLDDVADGENYGKVAVTDISAGHILLSACSGDLDDIADGTYGKVLSTDISSGHILLSSVVTDATHRYTTDAEKAAWNAKPEDMDALGDGVTYGKVLQSALSEGLVLLSEAVGDLDDVAEGTTYGKVLKTDISAGHIVLSSVEGDLDDVADGTSYAKVLATDISAGHILLSSVVTDANHRYTTDAEKAAWNAKPENMDEISDGVTYAKVLATDISAGHILLSECIGSLDNIADGASYGKVAVTDIQSGHILLSTVITDSTHRVTTDAEKTAWNSKPNNMDDIPNGSTYKKVLAIDIDASTGHLKLSSVVTDSNHTYVTDAQKTAWTAKPDNMDQISDGSTYKKVLATDISAGHILLSSVITDSNHRVTTDAEKASWNSKPENMDQIADGSTYAKVLSTSISAGKIVVAGLADDVKARMFSDSTARANIEAWRKSGSPTSIDGAYIYARTIVAEKIVCVGSWSLPIAASDVVQNVNSGLSQSCYIPDEWLLLKEMYVNDGFNQTPGESFKVKCSAQHYGGNDPGYLVVEIRKNGTAITGQEWLQNTAANLEWTISTTFNAGDRIQIYGVQTLGTDGSGSVGDMKLCYGQSGVAMARSVTNTV